MHKYIDSTCFREFRAVALKHFRQNTPSNNSLNTNYKIATQEYFKKFKTFPWGIGAKIFLFMNHWFLKIHKFQ